jgi:hypothetical protein
MSIQAYYFPSSFMKARFLPLLLSALAITATASAEPKKYAFDCEAWEVGEPPKDVFVVEGKFNVVAKDGGKALQVEVGELTDSNALLGDSAAGSASIEAKVFGTKQGRSVPKFAVGVHGQSGYRLIAFAARKELQLTKGDEVIKVVPLTWKSDEWFKLKLEVKKVDEKKWTISAKAWPASGEEPKEALITHEDTTLKGQGKCSIWGTTFSNMPILFDDVKIEIEAAPAK